eukprot:1348856-Amorphochlora_amoeboformis.AAC.1
MKGDVTMYRRISSAMYRVLNVNARRTEGKQKVAEILLGGEEGKEEEEKGGKGLEGPSRTCSIVDFPDGYVLKKKKV